MYKVYCDDVLVYDPRIEELSLENPVLNLALNDAGEFTFTVPDTHPQKDVFKPLISTIRVYRDGDDEALFIGRIVLPEGDYNNSITYTCEGALAFLNDTVQPPAEFHDITPMGYVGVLLETHNKMVNPDRQIKLGAITVTDPNNKLYRYTNDNSTLQELKEDIIDDLGGYCRIREEEDGLYLDILKDYGIRCEQTIEFQENLIDFTKSQDYTELITAIIPRGAKIEELNEGEIENNENDVLDKRVTIEDVNDGKDYLINKELYDKYGGIWRTVTWDDVHLAENLKRKAEEWMAGQDFESLVIDAKAFDFSYIDGGFESFKLGEEIRVISKPHNLDRWFTLSQMEIHLDSLSENTITLGGKGRPVSLSSVTTGLTITTGELDNKQVVPNKLIEQAINQATQLIHSQTHGYVVVEPNEILIMDTPDKETAKNIWRWNMGGLGFSSTGYNGTFETAITMDGTIVGKFIAANSIAAEQIDVNYRTRVEQNIKSAEDNANDYTDGKLKDYWTSKEVETYVKTEDGKITAGVNATLKNYSTTNEIQSMLSITEGNIKTYVSDRLSKYSTTTQVSSMIDQKADSITTTVNNTLKNYSTTSQVQSMIQQKADSITTTVNNSINSLEQKVTADGIFTTINNGLAGNKSIYNTKFSMTRDGLTIEGGGITIKNNSGTSVLYADTSGNLTLRGDVVHYGSTTYKAIGIEDHEVRVYAWNQSGNYLGSLGATVVSGTNTPALSLWSDYGDDLQIGSRTNGSSTHIDSIIELGTRGGSLGIHYIRDTVDGNLYVGDASLRFDHGLITGKTGSAGISKTITLGVGTITFANGGVTASSTNFGGNKRMGFGSGYILVQNGLVTGWDLASFSGNVTIGGTPTIVMTFANGICSAVATV